MDGRPGWTQTGSVALDEGHCALVGVTLAEDLHDLRDGILHNWAKSLVTAERQ